MTWFKIDDSLYDHPKVEHLSLAAVGLWTLAGTYCARQLTDGVISHKRVGMLGGTDSLVAELVGAGLWVAVEEGYEFHDWTAYQPTRQEVEAKREGARERQRKHRRNVNVTRDSGVSHANVTALVTAPRPDPTRPDHIKDIPSPADAVDAVSDAPDLFAEFWTAYPRKVGKDAARKSWAKAVKRADPQHIIAAALRFRRDPNLPADRGFIPHPATWLNQGRWDDEPLPERSNGTKAPSGAAMFMSLPDTYQIGVEA